MLSELDQYLSPAIRSHLEATYYAQVNAQARLDRVIYDPDFIRDPENHVALFADHGVVHVRDVARQVLQVLDTVHGVLIPARPGRRLDLFMKSYGVMLAYLHDIGMADFSRFGRAMHPEFAAQFVFEPEADSLVETIWEENWGNIAWRLVKLCQAGELDQDPRLILREMLSLSSCHSKSKAPPEVLGDTGRLRRLMQVTLATDLPLLYQQQQAERARRTLPANEAPAREQEKYPVTDATPTPPTPVLESLRRHYADFAVESFRWLLAEGADGRALVNDVVDTLRVLRCADALRQRGTVLKTSGGYEMFIEGMTASAVYALRSGEDRLFLLAGQDPLVVGEANLAASEVTRDGNLRIAFHRGAFATPEAVTRAAHGAAVVVNDIQADVAESFRYALRSQDEAAGLKTWDEILVLLEGVDDHLDFAPLVREHLLRLNPGLSGRVHTVPSLQRVPEHERVRYLGAPDFDGDRVSRQAIVDHLAQSGHNTATMDLEQAFDHVKVVSLQAGEVLVEAGAPASFVYVPLSEGLRISPLGGYQTFAVRPWMPLGNTGVIRGAERNATVQADNPVTLLMIPKEVYLRHWHHPYSASELVARLTHTPPF